MNRSKQQKYLLKAVSALGDIGRIESANSILEHMYGLKGNCGSPYINNGELTHGISIIIPTYLGESRITRTLDSIVAQTESRGSFEVIIVSNGPEDSTKYIVERYQNRNRDLNILYLRTPLASASNARNYGLYAAKYSYTTFVDDDDYISPQFLSVLLLSAAPNRLVFSSIIDFDDSGHKPSPVSGQVLQASKGESEYIISNPYDVRGIMSMTCAKLAPTAHLKNSSFDVNLRSGEDVVFWADVLVSNELELYVPPGYEAAIYYREIREGSVSRRKDQFSFSVTERLEVIYRIQELCNNRAYEIDPIMNRFLLSRCDGQIGFIVNFLKDNKDFYPDFASECARIGIEDRIVNLVNDRIADTLVISYCFPPFNDTSAIVMMKRILSWKWPVRAVSNDMRSSRIISEDLGQAVKKYLVEHIELKTPTSFSNEADIRAFAEQTLEAFDGIPPEKVPSKIYSRAMWPASHFAAALIKIKHPKVEWIAEFSDPLLLDIHGDQRKGSFCGEWLQSSGLRDIIANASPKNINSNQVFLLAELLPYILADKIIFTNEIQREYMLSQPWVGSIAHRVFAISDIVSHPTLGKEYYSLGKCLINVDSAKVNIGFFGSFYATRGLREVLLSFKRLAEDCRRHVMLHVISSDAKNLADEVRFLDIEDMVHIHPSMPYFDCLASFKSMDYLLVNDAATLGIKSKNPYLPSKLSDYIGAEQPVWALVEPGSPLSTAQLISGSIKSNLGNEDDYLAALKKMISNRA